MGKWNANILEIANRRAKGSEIETQSGLVEQCSGSSVVIECTYLKMPCDSETAGRPKQIDVWDYTCTTYMSTTYICTTYMYVLSKVILGHQVQLVLLKNICAKCCYLWLSSRRSIKVHGPLVFHQWPTRCVIPKFPDKYIVLAFRSTLNKSECADLQRDICHTLYKSQTYMYKETCHKAAATNGVKRHC